MDDNTYKKWDVVSKIVVPVITVVGLLLGVWQFNKERAEQLKLQHELRQDTHKREFKRYVWEKQAEIYLRMGDVVGKIAAGTQDKQQLRKDINAYNSLYWGVTNYVDDEAVEAAMKKLYLSIRELDSNPDSEENVDVVKILAKRLVETCREANEKFWFDESQSTSGL